MSNTSEPSPSLVHVTLRNRYPHLSARDLQYERGGETALVDRLHQRTGDTREAIAALLCSVGVNVPLAPRPGDGKSSSEMSPDVDHSRGSGIPDDTSRSGASSA